MGKKRELRTHWQRVCKLILAKDDLLTVSRALELALFMDAKLDVSKIWNDTRSKTWMTASRGRKWTCSTYATAWLTGESIEEEQRASASWPSGECAKTGGNGFAFAPFRSAELRFGWGCYQLHRMSRTWRHEAQAIH
jgi:hypothetical protein